MTRTKLAQIVNFYLKFKFNELYDIPLTSFKYMFGGFKPLGTARGWADVKNKKIYLNRDILNDESIDTQQYTEIVLHEICHAIDFILHNTSSHNTIYKKICKSVGHQTGVNGNMIANDYASLGNINKY